MTTTKNTTPVTTKTTKKPRKSRKVVETSSEVSLEAPVQAVEEIQPPKKDELIIAKDEFAESRKFLARRIEALEWKLKHSRTENVSRAIAALESSVGNVDELADEIAALVGNLQTLSNQGTNYSWLGEVLEISVRRFLDNDYEGVLLSLDGQKETFMSIRDEMDEIKIGNKTGWGVLSRIRRCANLLGFADAARNALR